MVHYIPKIIGGVSTAVLVGILGFMGNGIINNDVRNTDDHKEIRVQYQIADMAVYQKVEKVKDIVTDIRVEQAEQRILLQGIAGKL